MPRVKRSVHARKKRRKVLEQAKGYWGLKIQELPAREGAGRPLAQVRLPRPQGPEARHAAPLDHPHQRRRAAARALVQPVHRRLQEGGDRARPQGAGRPRRQRPRRLRRDRRAGQVGARYRPRRLRPRRDCPRRGLSPQKRSRHHSAGSDAFGVRP